MKGMQQVVKVFLSQNTADQLLGKSMRPFSVETWPDDQDPLMASTLSAFAEVAEVDAKDLAKDIISLRPFVRRELTSGRGLLACWVRAARAYRDRATAVPKSLYALCALFRGTGSLEGRFQIGKLSGTKNALSDHQLTSRMRIWMNGPPIEQFCTKKIIDGILVYEAGPLCLLAQKIYAERHGTIPFATSTVLEYLHQC
jgi:hypothetical protein